MAGPIGYGVAEGQRRARKRGDEPRSRPPSPRASWLFFVGITMGLSWISAALFAGSLPGGESPPVRLFRASLYYAAVMGWQPLVGAWLARWVRQDRAPVPGLRGARVADVAIAVGVAAGLAAVAMVVARLVGEPAPTGAGIGGGLAAAALLILCVQALTEEYGWRGFPLACAVETWGPRAGLVIHGVAWGAWYAPLFLVASSDPRSSLAAAGGFVVTCLLLGVVLGWLRLRSGSLLPSAVANVVLTVVAGLPLLLHDGSTGARDAVFRWPGWPVLGVAALLILARGRLAPRPAA